MRKKTENTTKKDPIKETDILDPTPVQGAGLLFDPKKIEFIAIDDIVPNSYNPKDEHTPEYEAVKKSISEKGLRGLIYVRNRKLEAGATKPSFEIVDGEQRWRICNELHYKQVPIYNLGDMPLKEAQELTIYFEQAVPFSEIKLADLIKDIVQAGEAYSLPYSQEQIDEYLKMADFSWEQYKGEMLELEESDGVVHMEVDLDFLKKLKKWIAENEKKERGGDHKRKMIIVGTEKYKVLQEQMKIIKQAIETCMIANDITSEGRALELIAADFISSVGVSEKDQEGAETDPDWVTETHENANQVTEESGN